jgi:formamidopyrimidine-DNA glycosylase
MPELAEVEYYSKKWDPGIGKIVERVELNAGKRIFRDVDLPRMKKLLTGSQLLASETKGKQMCFIFSGDCYLGVHLGMTGKLRVESSNNFERDKHDHLVLQMRGGAVLAFNDSRMFGKIRFGQKVGGPDWWVDLPPEVLSDDFSFERMDAFLNRRARSPLKAVLLMQEMFPGVGNWMADEILWRSRLHPAARPIQLSKVKRKLLYNKVREVCSDAMDVIGTDWSTPPNDWLFNHRWKDGGQCPKTGVALKRETIGGRTTCWSPKWQLMPKG